MSRRISLREYQEGVVKRLQALSSTAVVSSKLGIQVGRDYWLVDLQDVSEVLPVPKLIGVPLTKSWFRGVANIRGNLYSVVDLPAFLGDDAVNLAIAARLLLIHPKHLPNSAVLVNRMLGLRSLSQLQESTAGLEGRPWVTKEYVDADNRVWKELNVRELVRAPEFLHVGQA